MSAQRRKIATSQRFFKIFIFLRVSATSCLCAELVFIAKVDIAKVHEK